MARLFFRLYLVLAAALLAFGVGVYFVPKLLLRETEARYFERISRGTFFLAEKTLRGAPVVSWAERFEALGREAGYPLLLEGLDRIRLPPQDRARLEAGRVVAADRDGAPYLHRRVGRSPYAIVAGLGQTRQEDSQRAIRSTFHLIARELLGRPAAEWAAALRALQPAFGFTLSLERLDRVDVSEADRERLRRGEIVAADIDATAERFLRRVAEAGPREPAAHNDAEYLLVLSGIGNPYDVGALQASLLAGLAAVLAVAVFLWVRPLRRDLVRLDGAAAALGQGHLEARAIVPRRSQLANLCGTFNEMAGRIERLVDSHRELTNAVSHELRTPVARLRFGLEMLRSAPDAPARARHLEGLRADVDEIDGLVSELLAFARLERTAPGLEWRAQPVVPWLREVVEDAREEWADIDLSCRAGEVPEEEAAAFDTRFLARAVRNLLANAGRHARSRAEVVLEACAEGFAIHVDDDGPGVPEADRQRIFEPFTRLESSRDRSSGGHGLGLAIVRRVAERHGGWVEVSESPLGGARFTVRWPRRATGLGATEAPSETKALGRIP